MNNADLIVATLKANGVTRGFGSPSGNVLPFMEAMRKGGLDLTTSGVHDGTQCDHLFVCGVLRENRIELIAGRVAVTGAQLDSCERQLRVP